MQLRLGDIAQVIMGQSPQSQYFNSNGQGKPFLQGNRTFGSKFPTYDTFTTAITKLGHKNSVVMSVRAPVGELNVLSEDTCLGRGVCALNLVDPSIDPDFLFYALKGNSERLKAKQSGTVFGSINKSDIESLILELPDKAEWNAIAKFLGDIDRKILVNEQINKNLLDQVIALSKHIQESSSNMGVLSEIAQYSRNKVPVSSLDHNNYYSTENILANKGGSTRAEKLPSTELTIAVEPGDTLVSNIRPYFKKLVFVNRSGGCSNDVLCLHPLKPELQYYLYSVIYDDRFFDFMTKGSKGTKMPRGDKAQIMSYPLCLLSKEGLERFNGLVTPIFQEIKQLDYESRLLTQLRDELLPRLLSGEIELQ